MKKIVEFIKNVFNKPISNKQCKIIIFLYCLLNAVIFLFICSKNSPLYPFNNWDDAN